MADLGDNPWRDVLLYYPNDEERRSLRTMVEIAYSQLCEWDGAKVVLPARYKNCTAAELIAHAAIRERFGPPKNRKPV